MIFLYYYYSDFPTSNEESARNETVLWLQNNDNPQEEEYIPKWKATIGARNPPGRKIKNHFLLYKGLQSKFGHILVNNFSLFSAKLSLKLLFYIFINLNSVIHRL